MPRYAVAFNRAGAVIIVRVTADNEADARNKARQNNRTIRNSPWLRTKRIKEVL